MRAEPQPQSLFWTPGKIGAGIAGFFALAVLILVFLLTGGDDAGEELLEVGDEIITDGEAIATTSPPIESGTFEGVHWIKWRLDTAISDPIDVHTIFQLNIQSAEDDVFGAGWTIPLNEAPFAAGFCLEDRPNCDDGTVPVEVEVGSERAELIFRIPQGSFRDATGLELVAFIQTFPTADANPVTVDVTDGVPVPLGTDQRDPC